MTRHLGWGKYCLLPAFVVMVGGMFLPGLVCGASVNAQFNLRMHLLTIYDTPTATATISPTATITPTMTESATDTATRTITPTPTPSPTSTESPTVSVTMSESPTSTITLTFTPTALSTLTDTPTETTSPAATFTPTWTASATVTLTHTPEAVIPTLTGTPTLISTATPFVRGRAILAYPNPARGQVNFAYTISGTIKVQIDIFRLTGERVASIVDHKQGTGQTLITAWNADGIAPGIYLCRVVITDGEGNEVLNQTNKVAVVK